MNALRELEYWQSKYSEYKEFGRIFKAIESTKQRVALNRKQRKSRKNGKVKK